MKSDKSVLVIDTPNNCYECQLAIDTCHGTIPSQEWYNKKPEWCPLRPLPKKRISNFYNDETSMGFKDGFNECLLLITGETDEAD